MAVGLYSGVSGLALGVGLYRGNSGLWGGSSGLINGFGGSGPFPGASLYLDFLTPPLDSRITFSRGSNATLVDRTGKITYAPANMFTYSQEFDNAIWTKQGNGVALAPVVTADAGVAPDGTNTADRAQFSLNGGTATGDISSLYQPVTFTSGPAIFSVYLKSNTLSSFNMQINNPDGSGTTITVTPEWQRFNSISTTAVGTVNYTIRLRGGQAPANSNTADVLVWGAQLEPVTYQTTPSTYVATTASAYYGPRFDYDPVTLAPKGLLIEEARTNLLLYSEQFDNAAWSKGNATVTANVTMSPDGTTNADMITQTAASPVVYQAPTLTAVPYTASIRFKQGTATGFELVFGTSALALGVRLTYTFATNTTVVTLGGTPTGVSTSVTPIGNGWYEARITVTATVNIWFFDVHPVGSNGQTVYLYGAQLEAGSFATSYIPTVASTVTRSADVATMTGTNFSSWYNQSEGTFISLFDSYLVDTSTRNALSAYASGATSNNILLINTVQRQFQVNNSGNQVDLDGGTPVSGAVVKAAGAYKLNDFALSLDGGAVVTDTAGTVPTVDTLGIGISSLSLTPINGHIRAIAYYNTRLPNAQLQTLTAPSLATTLTMSFTDQAYTVGV